MKVLMFGWEFPPHISGGLGTACFGLTESLCKLGVEVLFVVPKLHGDEPENIAALINASEVSIIEDLHIKKSFSKTYIQENRTLQSIKEKTLRSHPENMRYVEVSSNLIPYQSPNLHLQSYTIEQWNYELENSELSETKHAKKETEKQSNEINIKSRERTLRYNFSGTYGQNLFEEVEQYAKVAKEIATHSSFDIIHAHDWMTYQAGVIAKEVSGKPLAVHVHATEFDRAGNHINPYIFALEKYGMEKADHVYTVSKRTKKIAHIKYGIPEHKIHVVYNGIIPKSHVPTLHVPELGSHVITFLGRVTHQKGPQYFVEAARLILKQLPDAHFIVAGSGDLLPQIINRVAQLRLSSRFHFTGFLKGDKIEKVWAMSDVYVMPSVSEPFGIAPLEAIQGGVPVVLSNQSGVAEVMPHAMKVDFWDVRSLANSIVGVLKYKSLSDTLKKYSKEEIEAISWEKVATKIKHLYHELHRQ